MLKKYHSIDSKYYSQLYQYINTVPWITEFKHRLKLYYIDIWPTFVDENRTQTCLGISFIIKITNSMWTKEKCAVTLCIWIYAFLFCIALFPSFSFSHKSYSWFGTENQTDQFRYCIICWKPHNVEKYLK